MRIDRKLQMGICTSGKGELKAHGFLPKPSLLSAVVLGFVVGIVVAGCSKPPEIVGDWALDVSRFPIISRVDPLLDKGPTLSVEPDLKGKFLGTMPISVGKVGIHGFFYVGNIGAVTKLFIKLGLIYKSGNRYRMNYYLKSPNNLRLVHINDRKDIQLIRMVGKNAPKN